MVTRTASLKQRGFTLIELIVSIGIIMIILSVVIFNHQKFNDSLRITNVAYQVALSIRQAQSYGINVRGYTVNPGTQEFDVGYGVHFDKDNKTSYVAFVDRGNKDRKYDPSNETISTVSLENGYEIEDICSVTSTPSDSKCMSTTGSWRNLDITFYRYTPDAVFTPTNNGGSSTNLGTGIHGYKIFITSPQNGRKQIEVSLTGQISISNVP